MRTNHRILGMESHIAYGVCFILPVLALVVLIIDRRLSRENKLFMIEALLGMVVGFLLGLATFFIGHALGWAVYAIMIFIGVLNVIGHVTHLPFLDVVADKLVR